MIAFGSAITKPEVYRHFGEVGIQRAVEPDSEVFALPSVGSIFASYNALLDKAAACVDLEALVLVHQDAEIVDHDFCARARRALRDPQVGLVGCVGAIDVRSIAWWEGSVTLASFVHRYDDHGGGDLPAFSWVWDDAPPYARLGQVDTLDGFLLVLSPWTVQNLRFDESLGQFHGYDFDFCLQVRAAGRKVVTADFRAVHNHALEPFSDPEPWITAHMKVAEKWEGRFAAVGTGPGTWEERALRAEAGRDAARVLDHSNALDFQARARGLERAFAELTGSISWRITAPLRLLARARRSGAPNRARLPLRARLARVDVRTR
jgi:Glycosyltransferase like family